MDASGTLEAIRAAIASLPQEPVSVRFLHSAAGPVTQADIDLAAAAPGTIVLAFNTRMQVSSLVCLFVHGLSVQAKLAGS